MRKHALAIVAVSLGALLVLIALIDPRESAFQLGRGPVAAGSVLLAAIGAVLFLANLGSRYRPALQTLGGTACVACFAVLSAFVSFGNPLLMLFSFLPCLALTGLGVRATVRDFRKARQEARAVSDASPSTLNVPPPSGSAIDGADSSGAPRAR